MASSSIAAAAAGRSSDAPGGIRRRAPTHHVRTTYGVGGCTEDEYGRTDDDGGGGPSPPLTFAADQAKSNAATGEDERDAKPDQGDAGNDRQRAAHKPSGRGSFRIELRTRNQPGEETRREHNRQRRANREPAGISRHQVVGGHRSNGKHGGGNPMLVSLENVRS